REEADFFHKFLGVVGEGFVRVLDRDGGGRMQMRRITEQLVGWIEQRETHQGGPATPMVGFAPLNPPYALTSGYGFRARPCGRPGMTSTLVRLAGGCDLDRER